MIVKSYSIDYKKIILNNLILIYGKNDGLKDEIINNLTTNKTNIYIYDEKNILDKEELFYQEILTKSLFEEEKIIIIKRVSDKLFKLIHNILNIKIDGIKIFLNAYELEKKSKLRSLFEKEKDLACIPVYPDNEGTLTKIAYNFLKTKKIAISQSNLNQIVLKSSGDRENLLNELNKIENYLKNGKKLTNENILKLINLSENYSIEELINNCLAKNKTKTIRIFNENNYTNDDCILISRTFLIKLKRILRLKIEYENSKDLNLTISNARPPIFWKEKTLISELLQKWSLIDLKSSIYKTSEMELIMKKNFNNSLKIISDFLIQQSTLKINN